MEWTIPTTDFANLYDCVFAWIIQSFKRTNELFNTSSGSVATVLKEAGARVCSIKKVFFKFSQNLQVFSLNYAKFLRTSILKNTSGQLVQYLQSPDVY